MNTYYVVTGFMYLRLEYFGKYSIYLQVRTVITTPTQSNLSVVYIGRGIVNCNCYLKSNNNKWIRDAICATVGGL